MGKIAAAVFLAVGFLAPAFLGSCGKSPVADAPAVPEAFLGVPPDVPRIVVTFQTLEYSSVMTDFDEVAAEVNRITVPEIGVAVDFAVVDAVQAFTEYPLWISQGKQVDLMVLNYQDIMGYIGRNMVLPLDGLLQEEGKDILSVCEDGFNPMEGSVVQKKTYGVTPVSRMRGNGGGIWIQKEKLEEAGVLFDETHVYTFEELSVIFGRLKERYPQSYPLGQVTAPYVTSTYSFYGRASNSCGGDTSSGVYSKENGKIENFFSTAEYARFIGFLREWYLAGYIYPDAAITDVSQTELLEAGVILTYPLSSAPGFAPKRFLNGELVCLRTSPPLSGGQYSRAGFWVIPVTSADPKAAMRFLNLLYQDSRIGNLLSVGVEGKHYVMTNAVKNLVSLPPGQSALSVGYFNPLMLYGDYRKQYAFLSEEDHEKELDYAREASLNEEASLLRGITYSSEKVSRELSAVQEVVEKYIPYLESGSVDLEKYYPEFLAELDRAGMDAVLQDKQRQVDAWLLDK